MVINALCVITCGFVVVCSLSAGCFYYYYTSVTVSHAIQCATVSQISTHAIQSVTVSAGPFPNQSVTVSRAVGLEVQTQDAQRSISFVLLADRRGGSTWFQTMLDSHPSICMMGEMLSYTTPGSTCARSHQDCKFISNVHDVRYKKAKPMFLNDWRLEEYLQGLYSRNPDIACCNSRCGELDPSQKNATGFKLFSDHVDWLETRNDVGDIYKLLEARGVSIIIFRRNPLSTYVSERHAKNSGVSHCGRGCNVSTLPKRVHIDPRKMLRRISSEDATHRQVDLRLLKYPRLRILRLSYEDFAMSPEWCRVITFLGLDCSDGLRSPLQKKGAGSLASRIENVHEVRSALLEACREDLSKVLDGPAL